MVRGYSSVRQGRLGVVSPRGRRATHASTPRSGSFSGNGIAKAWPAALSGGRRRRRTFAGASADGLSGAGSVPSVPLGLPEAEWLGDGDIQADVDDEKSSMTELERLTAYYDAVHRGEDVPELSAEEIAREDALEAQARFNGNGTAMPVPAPLSAAEALEVAPAAPPGDGGNPGLLQKRPKLAAYQGKPKTRPPYGLYLGVAVALVALFYPLQTVLRGSAVYLAAGAGCIAGIGVVQWLCGARPSAKRKPTKSAAELRRVSRGLKAQHRGDHDAVGNRTFRLRGARVQVLDVRVMEGTYATYRITVSCRGQAWDVWHRYAEFDTLRAALDNAGALPDAIPSLPPKTFGHRFDQTFLLGRKDRLRAFMTALVQHDGICDRDDVRRFLLMPPLAQDVLGPPSGSDDGDAHWIGQLMTSPAGAGEAGAARSGPRVLGRGTRNSFESLSPSGGGRDGLYETETGEQVTVRMWKSPFKRSTLREILDEFSDAGPENELKVRGLHYCDAEHPDHRKKTKAGPALFELLHVDMFAVNEEAFPEGRHFHVAARGMARERVAYFRTMPSKPFLFIFNLQVPGDPPVSIVQYFAIAESLLKDVDISTAPPDDASPETKFYHMFKRFADFENTHPPSAEGEPEPEGSGILPRDDFRNERFKMLPYLHEAPWIVKNAVPVKPALMGRKLVCRYFRSDDYVEVDVDVASEPIARNLVGLCRGYARQLVVDMGIVFQGEAMSELPEKMAAVSRFHGIDLDFVQDLEEAR